jgi:hypothetical protein
VGALGVFKTVGATGEGALGMLHYHVSTLALTARSLLTMAVSNYAYNPTFVSTLLSLSTAYPADPIILLTLSMLTILLTMISLATCNHGRHEIHACMTLLQFPRTLFIITSSRS